MYRNGWRVRDRRDRAAVARIEPIVAKILASIALALGSAVVDSTALAQSAPNGREFRVNTSTSGDQARAAVASDRDGSFLVVWTSGPIDIRGRRFLASGAAVDDEHSLATGELPAVAMAAGGEFVVVWGHFYGVSGRRFDAGGAPRGGVFDVRRSSSGLDSHDVAMSPEGRFVVVSVYYEAGIYAERFDAAGGAIGEPMRVHDLGQDDGGSPAVAMDADGDFVVVWTRDDALGSRVLARQFTAEGDPDGPEREVSRDRASQKSETDVAMAPNGSFFFVVWRSDGQDGDGGGVFARQYDAFGNVSAGELQINEHTAGDQFQPAVTIGDDGRVFVAWTSRHQDGSAEGIYGRLLDGLDSGAGEWDYARSDGTSGLDARNGGEFRVNVNRNEAQLRPAVATGPQGTLIAVWDGPAPSGTSRDVFGRLFGAAGDADGDGVRDDLDNCPTIANPEQTDVGADGYGDECVSPDVFIPPSSRLGANPIVGPGTVLGGGVSIGDDAVLGDHVTIGAGVSAGDRLLVGDFAVVGARSRLGDDVGIGPEARIERGVTIRDGVAVGDHAGIRRGVVIDDEATIGPWVVLFAGARIGQGATIEMGARVGRRAIVLPGAVVPAGTSVPPGATVP